MAKSFVMAWRNETEPVLSGVTTFFSYGGDVEDADDVLGRSIVGVACTLSELWIKVPTNSTTSDSTFTAQDSGVSTSLSVTITSGTTGEFEDTANSAALAATDGFNYKAVNGGGGTFNVQQYANVVEADTDTVTLLQSHSTLEFNHGANADNYLRIMGEFQDDATVARADYPILATGNTTWADLEIAATNNTSDVAHTVKSNIDGVDGNQSITIGAGAADGRYGDTSNSDTVSTGGDLAFHINSPAGTGVVRYSTNSSSLVSPDSESFFCAHGPNARIDFDETQHWALRGANSGVGGTEASADYPAPFAFTLKNLALHIAQENASQALDYRSRVNGANGNLLIQVANSIGEFTDEANSDAISIDDEVNYQLAGTAGNGSADILYLGAVGEIAAAGATQQAATIAATSALGARSTNIHFGRAGLNATASLGARSRAVRFSRAGIAAAATVTASGTASGQQTVQEAASINATAALGARATNVHFGRAAVKATTTLTAVGENIGQAKRQAATISATASLGARATNIHFGKTKIAPTAALGARATNIHFARSRIAATASLIASGSAPFTTVRGAATIAGTSTMIASLIRRDLSAPWRHGNRQEKGYHVGARRSF